MPVPVLQSSILIKVLIHANKIASQLDKYISSHKEENLLNAKRNLYNQRYLIAKRLVKNSWQESILNNVRMTTS